MATKRIVVKVGTSSISHPNGRLHFGQLERLVRDIADLENAGYRMLLVSSGAIGAGMGRLGLQVRPEIMAEKQAVAAVGQGLLMQVYSRLFAEYGHICAQVLLTAEDLEERKRFLNCRNTLHALLARSVIPVVNENDSVAVDEIKFGDNDTLSALVANLVGADLLILLSDIDGVYDKDPRLYQDARRLEVVDSITPEIMKMAGRAGAQGTGGMATKLHAARIAQGSGIPMIIASGSEKGVIGRAVAGEPVGTRFTADRAALNSRKRWLAFYTHPQGKLVVDAGAATALDRGNSLLPIGVVSFVGPFHAGDLVQVVDVNGRELAKGISNYSSEEVERVKGKPSSAVQRILPGSENCEVIHRDNLVMVDF